MPSEPPPGPSPRLLEVRVVEVVTGRGRSVTLSSVRCPIHDRATAVEECAHCGEGEGIAQDPLARGGYLSCAAPPRARVGTAASGARVAEVMQPSAVAFRPRVTRGVASDVLRSRGVPVAPVVDGEGRPIGLVTEASLLRARSGTRVADAMTKVALSVLEGAPLGRAAALMAEHRVDRLAVVSGDGVVVGMLTAADVVSWVAAGAP